MPQITIKSTISKSTNQIATDLGGEAVILGLESEEYFSLDGVGLHIWEELEEPRTAAELLKTMLDTYEVEAATAERDLLNLLGEMEKEGLIEIR